MGLPGLWSLICTEGGMEQRSWGNRSSTLIRAGVLLKMFHSLSGTKYSETLLLQYKKQKLLLKSMQRFKRFRQVKQPTFLCESCNTDNQRMRIAVMMYPATLFYFWSTQMAQDKMWITLDFFFCGSRMPYSKYRYKCTGPTAFIRMQIRGSLDNHFLIWSCLGVRLMLQQHQANSWGAEEDAVIFYIEAWRIENALRSCYSMWIYKNMIT